MRHAPLCLAAAVLTSLSAPAADDDRNVRVRKDLADIVAGGNWIYNDLPRAFDAARRTGKPILVVLRCVPCEACRGFDEQVGALDLKVRQFLDRFVRVRIPQANGLDLPLFQIDFDLSFFAVFLNADRTIYGRFGSRSTQQDKTGETSIQAFREAMTAVLDLHARFDRVKISLRGKTGTPPVVRVPEEYPMLKGRYTAKLDYEGNVAGSCIHCHMVREAERLTFRAARQPIPDRVLFPWPLPEVFGLQLDPRKRATVSTVEKGSPAERSGLRAGDELVLLEGQPLVSIADVQWVLQNAPDDGELAAVARRGQEEIALKVRLEPGWRRRGDISWRATTWDLRRMATGGLLLEELTAEDRRAVGIEEGGLALRVKHAGEYGEHASAKNAGVRKGDIVVEVDGSSARMRETDLIARGVQSRAQGDELRLVILRDGERMRLKFGLR